MRAVLGDSIPIGAKISIRAVSVNRSVDNANDIAEPSAAGGQGSLKFDLAENRDVQVDLLVRQRHRGGKRFAVVQLAVGERAAHGLFQLAPRVEADISEKAIDRRFQCGVVHGAVAKPRGGQRFKRRACAFTNLVNAARAALSR